MRILHTYCLNYNVGDYALGIGVKNLLRDNLNVDLISETNIQGQVFDEYYIEEVVNKKYDLLVIGGGGIIHGSHWPNGWFWLIDKELIRKIKIPFIVYGVGNNYFEGEDIPAKAVKHLSETYDRSTYFSVRNDGSFERVTRQLSFTPEEVPDPGFHVGLNTHYEKPDINEPFVVLQLANDKTEDRLTGRGADELVNDLRDVVKVLVKTKRVILIPHVFADVDISRQVAEGIEGAEVLDFGSYAFDHTEKVLAYYKYAEYVLAMRGHGQIVPISFNTPVISLQNHPKHAGLMKKLELEEYNVNVNSVDFKNTLVATIEKIEDNLQDLRLKYENINRELDKQSKEAFKKINYRLNSL